MSDKKKLKNIETKILEFDPAERMIRSSLPSSLPNRKNDIYVSKQTDFNSQVFRCETLLNTYFKEVYLHAFGTSVNIAMNMALQIKQRYKKKIDIEVHTSSVEMNNFCVADTGNTEDVQDAERLNSRDNRLRSIIGGSECIENLMRDISKRLNIDHRLIVIYGMTELGQGSNLSIPSTPYEKRIQSVGETMDHTEVKVVDESGKIVQFGVIGEVCCRSYASMLYYWNDPGKTNETKSPDGWIKSGDLGVMSEDKSLQIVGRIKDIIIKGGENILHGDIESLLFDHPKIDSAFVVGVPDKRFGEEICAMIKQCPGETLDEEEVMKYCKSGKIPKFYIPKYILFVDDFPRTQSGKIQKFKMRKEAAKMLNLV